MYPCNLNSRFIKMINTSNIEMQKIDFGIHINFNSIEKWDAYKLNNVHIKTFIEKISTITYEEEYSVIEVIKSKIRDQKLVMREQRINESKNYESVTELDIKTKLSPEEYYHKYIKEKITSKPSENCFYAFSRNKRKFII
jgi:hypothetical protein